MTPDRQVSETPDPLAEVRKQIADLPGMTAPDVSGDFHSWKAWDQVDAILVAARPSPAEPREGLREFDDFMEGLLRDEIVDPEHRARLLARYAALRGRDRAWREAEFDGIEDERVDITPYVPLDADESATQDARRYRRLRILGVAPGNSWHLDNGMVLTFTGLDDFLDRDLKRMPSRGEAR